MIYGPLLGESWGAWADGFFPSTVHTSFSLYRTHLECCVSMSNCEMRHIPYDRIRKVERRGNRFDLYLDDDGETEKVSFSLDLIKDSERGEAREAFEGRMRELGVLHEK